METLRIYHVSDHYISYLHGCDHKVPYNKGARRPYVGIVFSFAGYKYFVPMESPKPNHANIKPGKHILKLDAGRYGLLGFNNMIPVPKEALIEFDINAEPDRKYRELLKRQVSLCNRIKADILNHAQATYFDVVGNKNKFLVSISCNFRKLEKASKSYEPNYSRVKSATRIY